MRRIERSGKTVPVGICEPERSPDSVARHDVRGVGLGIGNGFDAVVTREDFEDAGGEERGERGAEADVFESECKQRQEDRDRLLFTSPTTRAHFL